MRIPFFPTLTSDGNVQMMMLVLHALGSVVLEPTFDPLQNCLHAPSPGCVLYELLTQTHPFNAHSQGALFMKILKGKYPPVKGFSSKVTALLDRQVERGFFFHLAG